MNSRVCKKCSVSRLISDYYVKSTTGRVDTTCKPCRRIEQQARGEDRRAANREYARAWRRANPGVDQGRSKIYYHANKAKVKASVQARIAADPEKYSLLQRRSYLKVKYGITPEQYDEKLAAQGGRCAICGTADPGSPSGKFGQSFAVDHCHSTGVNRDLLCRACNTTLGLMDDDPDRLLAAAMYLMRHKGTLESLLPELGEG